MELPNLIVLSLILTLALFSKALDWKIKVEKKHVGKIGEDITIQCTYSYPKDQRTNDFKVYWKTEGKSDCSKKDKDTNAFVFHPNSSCVVPKYRGKTKLIGKKDNGSCSLLIKDLKEPEPFIYVRVCGLSDSYSFKKQPVSIYLHGYLNISKTADDNVTSTMSTSDVQNNYIVYLTIFVPVLGLLTFLLVGAVVCIKRKRNNTPGVNRPPTEGAIKESDYYVNFSSASSNLSNNKSKSGKSVDMGVPEQKAIDEAIYINFQGAADQTRQSADPIDNIYANVDCL
ncbi:uncharacterized protein ACNS7B_018833 [Menidia menidia]